MTLRTILYLVRGISHLCLSILQRRFSLVSKPGFAAKFVARFASFTYWFHQNFAFCLFVLPQRTTHRFCPNNENLMQMVADLNSRHSSSASAVQSSAIWIRTIRYLQSIVPLPKFKVLLSNAQRGLIGYCQSLLCLSTCLNTPWQMYLLSFCSVAFCPVSPPPVEKCCINPNKYKNNFRL